jgi:hypothetical protein
MKIVCISASFIPSKTANSIQVVKAAHAFAELGHQVTLLVPGEGGPGWEALKAHYGVQTPINIQWIQENLAFRRYDFALKAIRQARKQHPDLVYTWVLQAGVLALWQGMPTILEMHDRVTGRIGPWLFRRFYASTTPRRLVTITDALRKVLISAFDWTFLKSISSSPRMAWTWHAIKTCPHPPMLEKRLGFQSVLLRGIPGIFTPAAG